MPHRPFSQLFHFFFVNIQEGNPDVVIAAILISVSDGGEGEVWGQQGVPPDRDALKQ